MTSQPDFNAASWINQPENSTIEASRVSITTSPGTDFWQRSFYGFRNDNAPALLLDTQANFTFSCKVEFDYRVRFDQAGVIIYQNSDNWFKASIENEDAALMRLGSVVTNYGYSDWATTDISPVSSIWYRLSRRGPDFLIESSFDGDEYNQLRIFHLHELGETDPALAKAEYYTGSSEPVVHFGIYACSPLDSSFKAEFSELKLTDSIWKAHV